MAINIFADRPTIVIAKQSFQFTDAGLNSSNVNIIFQVDEFLRSWSPLRDINAITGATGGVGYYIQAKTDLDLSNYFFPPFDAAAVQASTAYPTLASLNADLNRPDHTAAYVTNDPTDANNGLYRKNGAVGTGTWVLASSVLNIIDNLGSTDQTKALSAKQGNLLYTTKLGITEFNSQLSAKTKDNLTDTNPANILSANQGRILDGKIASFATYDYTYVQAGVSTVNVPSWQYETSTFSGWAVNVAAQPAFNSARLKIRSWSAGNLISHVRMVIRDTNAAGTILADKTVTVTAPLATVVDVDFVFDVAVNTVNPLWVEYMCDGYCGLYGVLGAPFTTGSYTVAKNLITEPTTPLSGTVSGALVIFNNATPSAKLQDTVTEKVYNTLVTNHGIDGGALAKQALVSVQKLSVEKSNSGTQGAWNNESSIFRGWGNLAGSPQNFNGVQFKFRFWSAGTPVTQIRVVVKDTSYTGTKLADVTIPFVGLINIEQTVIVTFPNIVNAGANPIWIEYHADGLCGHVNSSLYGSSTRYTTNATITSDFSTSSSDDSNDSGVYFQVGTFVAVTQATTDFTTTLADQLGVQSGASLVRMLIPSEVYTVEGRELNAYLKNAIVFPQGYRLSNFDVDVNGTKGIQYEKYWRYKPVTGEGGTTAALSFVLQYRGVQVASSTTTVKIAAAAAGTGVTRKLIMIGDSTTAGGEISNELFTLFSTDAMHISLIGTQGTATKMHEGRGGWTVSDYATVGRSFFKFNITGIVTVPGLASVYSHNSSQYTVREVNVTGSAGYISCERTSGATAPTASGTLTRVSGTGDASVSFGSTSVVPGNPFWNAGTSLFDFANYLTVNSLTMAASDWVTIHLGINDVFGISSDATLVATVTTMLSQLNTMIANIRASVTGIRIGIFMTIPPANSQDAFGANYGNGQTRARYLENNSYLVKQLLTQFDTAGMKTNNIYIVPAALSIDTENNFQTLASDANSRNTTQITRQSNAVHPAASGYLQIADVVFNTLKNFA